jgi:hypothetical protein
LTDITKTVETPAAADTLQDLLKNATSASTWMGPFTLASYLTDELLEQIKTSWSTLDAAARVLICLATICIRRGQRLEMSKGLHEVSLFFFRVNVHIFIIYMIVDTISYE